MQDASDPTIQYVVQQGGRIRLVRNGTLRAADFLTLTGAISTGGERGLLGMALPPDHVTSGRFHVNFTNPAGHTSRPEIWSFGLRNPWKFSFDNPALGGTGAWDVYVLARSTATGQFQRSPPIRITVR